MKEQLTIGNIEKAKIKHRNVKPFALQGVNSTYSGCFEFCNRITAIFG